MKSVKLFNALDGKTVTREYLENLISLAVDEGQPNVFVRLQDLLDTYQDDEKFVISLISNTIPTVPESMLNGIDIDDLNEPQALNKAVTPDKVYKMITTQIVEMFSKPVKWEKEWGSSKDGYLIAYNFITKKPYRNVNAMVLSPALFDQNKPVLDNPYFLTANQIKKLGGTIKKGSHAHQIIYYNFIYRFSNVANGLVIKTSDKQEFIFWVVSNMERLGLKNESQVKLFIYQNTFAFLKYYNVFNGTQIDGIDFDLDNFDLPGKILKIENHHEKLPICEAIIDAYPNPKVKLTYGGQEAYFNSASDVVRMPLITQFKYVQAYYSTFFHELIHSTGSPSRLNREFGKKFGDIKYSYEELVAELGSVFLCAESGILHYTFRNSAAYLKGWRNALVAAMKDDEKFIFTAASKAQKAVDFMLSEFDYKKAIKEQFKAEKEKKAREEKVAKMHQKPRKRKINKDNQLNLFDRLNGSKKKHDDYGGINHKIPGTNLDFATLSYLPYDNLPRAKKVYESLSAEEKKAFRYFVIVTDAADEGLYEDFIKTINSQPKKKPKPLKGILENVVANVVANATLGEPEPVEEQIQEVVVPVVNNFTSKPLSNNPKVQKIGAGNNVKSSFYKIGGETAKFLQRVERKTNHSVVITMDGEQGAGKTTTLFKFMNDFAAPGNKSLFISGEEDPSSELFKQKVNKYLSPAAQSNLDAVGDVETVNELYELIDQYEIIFIDSWQKLLRMIGNIRLDEDLRKKFDGKVFVVIFQQTTTGRTKGGSEVVFDGDIIIKMVKEPRFSDNYAYFDKNRYTLVDTADIRYNIASGTVYNPNEVAQENESSTQPDQVSNQLSGLRFAVN
jgi:antirestriction protein ArdC/KaiC/GvpD/RAD55 family RecA-like ATPase